VFRDNVCGFIENVMRICPRPDSVGGQVETETDVAHSATLRRHRRDFAVLAVVFLLLIAFSYSEDIVFAVLEATGRDHVVWWFVALVGFDATVLAIVGLLKRFIAKAGDERQRLWRCWWVCFAAVVGIDVVLVLLPEDHPLSADFAFSIALATLMGLVMMVSLNADPLTLFSRDRRIAKPLDWARVRAVVPLVVERLGDRGEVAVHDERLVEGGVYVVRSVPSPVDVRVGTEHVVVHQDVAVAEFLDALGVCPHGAWVAAEFGLGKCHSDAHVVILPARVLYLGRRGRLDHSYPRGCDCP
jgi:hypothetical protein